MKWSFQQREAFRRDHRGTEVTWQCSPALWCVYACTKPAIVLTMPVWHLLQMKEKVNLQVAPSVSRNRYLSGGTKDNVIRYAVHSHDSPLITGTGVQSPLRTGQVLPVALFKFNDSPLMTGQVLPVASCNTMTRLWWQGRCYLLHHAIPWLTFDDRAGVQYHDSPLMTGQVCNTMTHLWWQDRCHQLDPAVVQGPGQHGHAPWPPCHAVAQACSGIPAHTVHLQWWPHLPGCLATWWPVDILGIVLHDLWHCDAATFNYWCQLFFLQNAFWEYFPLSLFRNWTLGHKKNLQNKHINYK